jgi:hypothetical protein
MPAVTPRAPGIAAHPDRRSKVRPTAARELNVRGCAASAGKPSREQAGPSRPSPGRRARSRRDAASSFRRFTLIELKKHLICCCGHIAVVGQEVKSQTAQNLCGHLGALIVRQGVELFEQRFGGSSYTNSVAVHGSGVKRGAPLPSVYYSVQKGTDTSLHRC